MKLLTTILLSLLAATTITAQDYDVRFFDESDGLTQWHTTRVLQDDRGFLWFSTWNGLNRFDGTNFDVFKVQPGDGNNVISDRIRDFNIEKDGTFLCRIDEEIFRFDPRTCHFSPVDKAIQSKKLQRMEKDRTSPWGTSHSITLGDKTIDDVHHEFTDRQGIRWFVSGQGIYRIKKNTKPFEYVKEVPHGTTRCMYDDGKGHIFVATKDNGNGVLTVFDNTLNLIGYVGIDGRIHKERTAFRDVFSLLLDRDNQLWIGTKPYGKPYGIYRMNANDLFSGKASEVIHGLGDTPIYDIKQDRNGVIWLATFGRGIMKIVDSRSKNIETQSLITNTSIDYPKECYNVRRILLRDDLMVVCTTSGLLVIDGLITPGGKTTINRHLREAGRVKSLSTSAVMDATFDAEGHLLVSTESGGVNISETTDIQNKNIDFRHVDMETGLGTDVCYTMMPLGKDVLIQCNSEMSYLPHDTVGLKCYGSKFWNEKLRFSDARPIVLKDGRLLISLERGAITVPLKLLTSQGYVPRIALTRLDMNDGTVLWNADYIDTLRLNPDQRSITIRFAALDYTADGSIRYTTKMGKDGKWAPPTRSNEINLFDLDPGTYKLYIRSTNAAGIWVDNERVITIIVEPRFYETTFALILGILLLVAIVAAITYTVIYIRGINRQRRETLEKYLALINEKEEQSLAPEPVADVKQEQTLASAAIEEVSNVAPESNAENEIFMQRLLKFVEENIHNSDIGVDEMASATATSRSSLNRKMKSLMGITPADFLKEARLNRAEKMLKAGATSTSNVAYTCGFSDPKYFSKCFKAKYGMTPKEYQKS